MRKNISSALAGFLAALLLWCLLPVTAEAAGASFSGSGSVRAGDSVTVTFSVSGSNIQGITAVLHYDSSALTLTGTRQLIGDSWSVDMSGGNLLAYDQSLNNPISGSSAVLAVTFRVKSGVAAGTKVSAAITDIVTSDGNSDQNLNDASWSASVASPPSGNANLSGLSCGSYALSPSFSAGTTEYSVTVPYDVSRLPLDYSAADGGRQCIRQRQPAVRGRQHGGPHRHRRQRRHPSLYHFRYPPARPHSDPQQRCGSGGSDSLRGEADSGLCTQYHGICRVCPL